MFKTIQESGSEIPIIIYSNPVPYLLEFARRLGLNKNKLFSPNIDIEILGDFVRGFSDFWTSYSFLANNKRIDKAGAYVHLINRPSNNFYRKNAEILYKTDAIFKEWV